MDAGTTTRIRTRAASGLLRRVAVSAVVLIPIVVGPHGVDTPGSKNLALTLCGLLALAFKGVEVLMGRPSTDRIRAPELALLGLACWSLLSVRWAVNPGLARTQALTMLGMFGVAWGIQEVVARPESVRRWLAAVVVVGLLGVGIDAAAILRQSTDLSMAESKYASWVFVHNNMAAAYIVMLAPLIMSFALSSPNRRARWLWVIPFAGLLTYLDLLGSRTGLIATVLSVVVVAALFAARPWLQRWKPSEGRWTVALGLVVLVLAAAPLSDTVRGYGKDAFYAVSRTFDLPVTDVGFRPLLWRKTVEMVREAPMRGVGAGNFPVEFARFERLASAKPHAHNDALHVLAELGVPGLVLLGGVFVSLGWMLIRIMSARADSPLFAPAAGMAGSLTVFVATGLFETPLLLGTSASLLALFIGLAAVLDGPDGVAVGRRSARWALGLVLLAVSVPALLVAWGRVPGPFLMDRALQAEAEGDTEAAREAYLVLAGLDTGSAVPHHALGELALGAGDGAAALAHFEAARELWPHGGEVAESEGDALVLLERYDEAVERFEEAVITNPGRIGPLYKLIETLEVTGERRRAVDLLSAQVAADPLISMDVVWNLAWAWRWLAASAEGDEQIDAWIAARHFFAVSIQDGDVARWPEANEAFKHLTHQIQTAFGGDPYNWWDRYERFLDEGGWQMPTVALYTSIDADGVSLFPGWHEPFGPPLPRRLRH